MDAIAESTITNLPGTATHGSEDPPSLLAVVIETNPVYWSLMKEKADLKSVIEALVVALNAHLAVNNSNKVIILAAHASRALFIFPDPDDKNNVNFRETSINPSLANDSSRSASPTPIVGETGASKQHMKSNNIYRQFKLIDETIFEKLEHLFNETVSEEVNAKSTVPGAISLALTYINRLRQINEGVTMNARLLVISVGEDSSMSYIPTMNSIFAAQGMKMSIDICKIGKDSTFLQQAADVTGGIYLLISTPHGLIQYLTTVFFIDPSIRNYVALPVNNEIDFRASCFVTGNIVDVGYVCSVCLCVLSFIPDDETCPTCGSLFDKNTLERLRRKPIVKKKTTNSSVETPSAPTTNNNTPAPQ